MTNWLAGYSESIRLLQDSEKKVQCSRQDENFGNNSGQVLLFFAQTHLLGIQQN